MHFELRCYFYMGQKQNKTERKEWIDFVVITCELEAGWFHGHVASKRRHGVSQSCACWHASKSVRLASLVIFLRHGNVFNKNFKREWWVESLLLEIMLQI